jgi:hypothetical protein
MLQDEHVLRRLVIGPAHALPENVEPMLICILNARDWFVCRTIGLCIQFLNRDRPAKVHRKLFDLKPRGAVII